MLYVQVCSRDVVASDVVAALKVCPRSVSADDLMQYRDFMSQ